MTESAPPPRKLLEAWLVRATRHQTAHYSIEGRLTRWNRAVGGATVALTTLAGTTLLASAVSDIPTLVRIAVGIVGIVAAVLASVQSFLGLADRAEHHRRAAASYGELRHRVEAWISCPPSDECALLEELHKRFTDLAKSSPAVPRRDAQKSKDPSGSGVAKSHSPQPRGGK